MIFLTNFFSHAWYEYTGWQQEAKRDLRRINALIKDIERNENTGIGKPEPLKTSTQILSRHMRM